MIYIFILIINFSFLLPITDEQHEAIESITEDVNKAPDFTLYSIESKDFLLLKETLIEMSNLNVRYKEKYNNYAFNINQLIQFESVDFHGEYLDSSYWTIELDNDNNFVKAIDKIDGTQFIYNVLDDEFSIFTSNESNLLELNSITLSEFENKVVLINFWATWCGPCRMEIPDLNELYQKYEDRGLEIFSISIDEIKIEDKKEQLIKFKNAYNIFYPILYGDNNSTLDVRMNYGGVFSIPMSFLINKKREVERVYPGAIMRQGNPAMYADLITHIEKLLVE